MGKNKYLNEIMNAISKILGVSLKKININSKSKDFRTWDSLAQIKIILAIEKITKKKIPSSKIADLNSIKSISNFLFR